MLGMAILGVIAVMAMVVVAVVVKVAVAMVMVGPEAAAADMMMVALLRRPDIALIADDLRAILAELTVHCGFPLSSSPTRSTKVSSTDSWSRK